MATKEVPMVSVAVAVVERAMKMQEVIVAGVERGADLAADILGLHPRTMRRWRARFERGGSVALCDRRRQPLRRQAPAAEVQHVLRLYRERYQGFNYGTSTTSPAATTRSSGSPTASSSSPCRRRAWCPSAGLGAAIAGAGSRAGASASCSTWTAAPMPGWPAARTSARSCSPSSTTLPVDREHLTHVGHALARLGIEHIGAYSPQAGGRGEPAQPHAARPARQ